MSNGFEQHRSTLPLIAILIGVTPNECEAVTEALYAAGFRIVEVPLNSPSAPESIERLAKQFGDHMLLGAGTVLTTDEVNEIYNSGGKLIVAPNTNIDVIRTSVRLSLTTIPGAATPSEAFAAMTAGADAVKVFPAEMVSPQILAS